MWGASLLHEEIDNWPLTILALVLLMIGIAGISLCNKQWEVKIPTSVAFLYYIPCLARVGSLKNEENLPINETDPDNKKLPLDDPDEDEIFLQEEISNQAPKGRFDFILGIGACLLLGLFNGTMLVPSQETEITGLAYAVCFALGVGLVTTCLAPLYFGFQFVRTRKLPKFEVKITLLPGVVAGLLWNAGNICSVFAAEYLGMTIGFPLTQMALLVSALWGMILFKEITRIPAIISFFSAALILIGGAVLLSLFG